MRFCRPPPTLQAIAHILGYHLELNTNIPVAEDTMYLNHTTQSTQTETDLEASVLLADFIVLKGTMQNTRGEM